MPQENILVNDIITDHRERMLNLKKYYPFFKLSEVSFSWYREGMYDSLDMGYILMAVLRFFIEENNFKERDVTYTEYAAFMSRCIRRDFKLNPPSGDMSILVEYIFDKLKNDGKPFIFRYFDPVDRKKKISRVRLIESRIEDGTVWYSISPEGIEFYLDTKEIKDESRISVEQLLLEKMIQSKDFKGGTDVVRRINKEVDCLWLRKNRVMSLLASDIFSGLEAYEDFFATGVKWFEEEQKLFIKNSELIQAAQKRAETDKNNNDYASYLKITGEIYQLDTELKIAMNNHLKLLSACTRLGIMADEMVKKAKLGRLRPSFDFRNALELAMKKDDITLLGILVRPIMGLNTQKTLGIKRIEDLITYKPGRDDKAELITDTVPENIVYDDELEDERIRANYSALIKVLLSLLKRRNCIDLRTFNECAARIFGEELFENGDYYSFIVHLCQKKEYSFEADRHKPETFLDEIFHDCAQTPEYASCLGTHFTITPADPPDEIELADGFTISNILFTKQ